MVPCAQHSYPSIPKCRIRTLTIHSVIQPEFAHPWEVLHSKTELTIASPKGGAAPLDPSSVKMFENDPVSARFLKEQESLWKNTLKLEEVLPRAEKGEFDAIFYVGGHGRMIPH
jgi:putative intracellular protease/amidase